MAVFKYKLRLHETALDDMNNVITDYDVNLPHAKEIIKNLCDRWNKDHDDFMLDLINKEAADNRLSSAFMTKCRIGENGESYVVINFTARKGKWLTDKIKQNIVDFMDAQLSDGWGESNFGYANVMHDKDSNKFIVE